MVCPEGLAASISAAAVAVAKDRTSDELGLLAAVFTQLGDTLATIAAAREISAGQQDEYKKPSD